MGRGTPAPRGRWLPAGSWSRPGRQRGCGVCREATDKDAVDWGAWAPALWSGLRVETPPERGNRSGPGESLLWVWGWLRWPVPDAWGGRRQDRDHQHSGCHDESGGLGTKSLNEQAAEQRTNRQSPKCKE